MPDVTLFCRIAFLEIFTVLPLLPAFIKEREAVTVLPLPSIVRVPPLSPTFTVTPVILVPILNNASVKLAPLESVLPAVSAFI